MTKNVKSLDRFLRAVLGLGLFYMPLLVQEPWAVWVGLVGAIPLASAIAGYCPVYKMCGCGCASCKCDCAACSCRDKSCADGDMKDAKKE